MSETRVKPSGWYYVLAGMVLVGSITGFVLFLVSGLTGLSDSLTQIVVPGERELTLKEAGDHTVFHEYRSVVGNKVYSTGKGGSSGLRCTLRSKATGREIPLSPSSMNSTYSMGSRSGASIFDFSIDSPGDYLFAAQYPPGQDGPETVLSVAQGFVKKLMVTILGGLGMMFGGLGLATAIAVITFVKRRRSRRLPPDLAEASPYRA